NEFQVSAVDPGRRVTVTAALGDDRNAPIRRVTSKEIQAQAGTKARSIKAEQRKAATMINMDQSPMSFKAWETALPTTRTASCDTYDNHVECLLQNMDNVLDMYGQEHSRDRFAAFRGRQRSHDFAANVLRNSGKKYCRSNRKKTKRNR
ncbi:hypothetical protein DM01DRAFT_1268300, partial [Hesseltinella vesiculosa]